MSKERTTLDVLEELLAAVRVLIAREPCACTVTDQGLQLCRRCILLRI